MANEEKNLADLVGDAFNILGRYGYHTLDAIYEEIKKSRSNAIKDDVKNFLENDPDYKAHKKTYSKKIPTLVLVGNSPNLIEKYNGGAAWGRLLKSLEDTCSPYLGETFRLASFPQRMQAVCNLYNLRRELNSSEEDPIIRDLTAWFEAVADLRSTAIHKMLGGMDFDYYLTTNYDYTLERMLWGKHEYKFKADSKDLFLKHQENEGQEQKVKGKANHSDDQKSIIHIHGVANDIKSIVMLPQSYVDATKALEKEPEWLSKFCESEVHICGLNLGPEESLVWHALEKRLHCLLEHTPDIRCNGARAYVYLFYNETDDEEKKDYHDKCAVRDLLRTYAVQTILIPVRNNDYIQAWKLLMGEMLLAKNGLRLQYEHGEQELAENNEDEEKMDNELEAMLKKIEFGGGRLSSRNCNMSTAFVPHFLYPYHCRMSISKAKSDAINEAGSWLCYCKIDSKRHMYRFSTALAKENYWEVKEENEQRNFLLDYLSGELYKIDANGKILHKVDKGDGIANLEHFCRMKYTIKGDKENSQKESELE